MHDTISIGGVRLATYLARPATTAAVPAVVLCHGFPHGPRGATSSASTLPELAERIAREIGWLALGFNFRGTGTSGGDFSPAGWLADLRGVVALAHERDDVLGVWLVGEAEGGTLAVCEAAADPRVAGVATLAAPVSLREWGRDPTRLVEYARRVGMIRTPDFPPSAAVLGREAATIDACASAHHLAPRPALVLHGSDDVVVPVSDARALEEALGSSAELRVVPAAGHELRHDPRAIASLLGWLERRV